MNEHADVTAKVPAAAVFSSLMFYLLHLYIYFM